jgi:hypothetical protein
MDWKVKCVEEAKEIILLMETGLDAEDKPLAETEWMVLHDKLGEIKGWFIY